MKKTTHSLLLLCLLGSLFLSCKKDDDNDVSVKVEYRIEPMNNSFTNITYVGSNGAHVVLNDWADFTGGAKVITVTSTPFNAHMETTLVNVGSTTINYTLAILVDDVVKAVTPKSAPPGATTTASVSYQVP